MSSRPGSRPRTSRRQTTRVVTVRTGVVIGRGGAMKPLLPLATARAGRADRQPAASTGRGSACTTRRRRSSTCSTPSLEGPVNLAGPTPATADAVLSALAHAVHRPYGLPLPEKAVDARARATPGRELLLAEPEGRAAEAARRRFRLRATATVQEAMDRLVARSGAADAAGALGRSGLARALGAVEPDRLAQRRPRPAPVAGRVVREPEPEPRPPAARAAASTSALYCGNSRVGGVAQRPPARPVRQVLHRQAALGVEDAARASRCVRRRAARGRSPRRRSPAGRGARRPSRCAIGCPVAISRMARWKTSTR